MSDEINTQNNSTDVDQVVASDTPASVVDMPAAEASSTPVSEPVIVPAPVEAVPVDVPVVTPPVTQTATTVMTSKFDQNKSGWREFLPKAWAGKKKKQLDKIAKVYAYIVKNKKVTTLRLRLYMLCRRETIEDYLRILIQENKIRRVGNPSSTKVYYEPV